MIDVVVPASFSDGVQQIQDQSGGTSSLSLGATSALVRGMDIVDGSMPMKIIGQAVGSNQQSWGRLLRLQGTTASQFFDIGIDTNGNLFLNGPNSTATTHLLTISPSGVITIP